MTTSDLCSLPHPPIMPNRTSPCNPVSLRKVEILQKSKTHRKSTAHELSESYRTVMELNYGSSTD